MTVVRRTVALIAASGIAAVAGLLPALPALAHGAPVQPVSRTAACAAGGEETGTAACRAARKANGGPFGGFDDLRVSGVNGRDVQLIPDGKLCSGGLAKYKGLDLPQTGWPSTKMAAGSTLTVRYRTTIPHSGVFRVYLTKQGWNPAKPLRWRDLSSKPIFTADHPPVRSGQYRFSGKLPADRTGRHVLLTLWQTTPDTYYSCSDLVLTAVKAKPAAVPPKAKKPTAKHAASPKASASRSPGPGAVATPGGTSGTTAAAAGPERESWITTLVGQEKRVDLGHEIILAVLVVLVGVGAGFGLRRFRASRAAQQIHRYPENR